MALHKHTQTALILSTMMALVPTLGFPNEELLQDTLKSILVSFFTLGAALFYFWKLRKESEAIHLHALLLLPLALMFYALGSTLWSHTYLASVEAIRWFIFSLLLFLGMNALSQARMTHLAWGIHIGAVMSALWAALQFWVDFSFFAQGPNPASTFVNRNFFGEFIVCTFPFSALLLTRVKDKISVFFLTFSLAFNIVSLMMAGTRSALVGLLILTILLPGIVLLYRRQVVSTGWRYGHCIALVLVFAFTVAGLGSIETTNPVLIQENSGRVNALERAFTRTLSLTKSTEYSEGSFSVRVLMWKATWKMIEANPVSGVGAGAWEVNAPLFQEEGSQLETDFYAHNEILQLLAEYGFVGCLFLVSLIAYFCWSTFVTWANKSKSGQREGPLRAFTLASLLVFLIVSNAGFPWRMASTGAMFALSLAILAASDARLGAGITYLTRATRWNTKAASWALATTTLCSALALFIAQQAIECESKIVRAVKIALTIARSEKPNEARWDNAKSKMLQLIDEGIVINPHYRKITPIVADALASWGDWKNATWIWKSVLESRPYVVGLLINSTRGEMQVGDFPSAAQYLERARTIQPKSLSLRSLEVILLSRSGKEADGALLAKALITEKIADPELVRTAYYLGMRTRDPQLAIAALELRIRNWPEQAVDGWLKLAQIYNAPEAKDDVKALQSYQAAYDAAKAQHRTVVLANIPQNYRARIK